MLETTYKYSKFFWIQIGGFLIIFLQKHVLIKKNIYHSEISKISENYNYLFALKNALSKLYFKYIIFVVYL